MCVGALGGLFMEAENQNVDFELQGFHLQILLFSLRIDRNFGLIFLVIGNIQG